VLDRAGRLQLPREMTEQLAMKDRVRLEAEPDHIGVWPDRPGEQRPPGPNQQPGEDGQRPPGPNQLPGDGGQRRGRHRGRERQ
jgi:hypothetical protein